VRKELLDITLLSRVAKLGWRRKISLDLGRPTAIMAVGAADLVAVVAAVHFAAEKHRKQMRKDGERPYINHPVAVMHILASEAGVHEPVVLQAAVLHDTGATWWWSCHLLSALSHHANV